MTTPITDNPFLQWLGASLAQWRSGYAELHLPSTPNLFNRTERIQGGVLCTLLDVAAGYAGVYAPPEAPKIRSVTLSLTTQFMASGAGQGLVAKGFLERKGRTVYFARAEVWQDEDLLLATAVGTYKYIR
ncbi:PaaI family thioesterase [Orrella sp. JC864]|uniref:PaaI family thioesterase n=1 Tax=Orrella sp. JC864 TaxID=3120298 RepID=UPI0012BD5FC6